MGRRDSWWEAGVTQVADSTYRIPLPLPESGLRAINVYALTDAEGLTLINAGADTRESRAALVEALATLGFELTDVTAVLVTHVHYDHYSQAVALRRDLGISTALGAGERDSVAALIEDPLDLPKPLSARLRTAGLGSAVEATMRRDRSPNMSWDNPSTWLNDSAVISAGGRYLRTVATPGHTRGHLVYHDEAAGLLFSGDHLLPTITPSVGFEPVPARHPLRDYTASLDRIARREDAVLMPAHGEPGMSAHRRIAQLHEHHEDRLGAILDTVRAGAVTALDSAKALPWRTRKVPFAELDEFDQFLAANETLAHLDVLADRHQLHRGMVDGVWTFHVVD